MGSTEHQIDLRRQATNEAAVSRRMRGAKAAPEAKAADPIFEIQRQAGNHAVNQAIQQLLRRGLIQAKLTVSNPGDPEEREADQVADHVIRAHAGFPVTAPCSCAEEDESCEACRQTGALVQRRAEGKGARTDGIAAGVSATLSSMLRRDSGQPLDAASRAFFESRLGRDLGGVKLHTGSAAGESALALGARAYTAGQEITFAPGEYAPETASGRKLLAHELAHVAQQSDGRADRIQRSVSFDQCEAREFDVHTAHDHAMEMVGRTIQLLRSYDGTNPASVATALNTHFHSTNRLVAWTVANNLESIKRDAGGVQYECHEECDESGTLAWSMWCVPLSDIRLYKGWFAAGLDSKAKTMVHEWAHRYACKLDLGYGWEPIYKQSGTLRALANAEPYGNIVQALGAAHG